MRGVNLAGGPADGGRRSERAPVRPATLWKAATVPALVHHELTGT